VSKELLEQADHWVLQAPTDHQVTAVPRELKERLARKVQMVRQDLLERLVRVGLLAHRDPQGLKETSVRQVILVLQVLKEQLVLQDLKDLKVTPDHREILDLQEHQGQ